MLRRLFKDLYVTRNLVYSISSFPLDKQLFSQKSETTIM